MSYFYTQAHVQLQPHRGIGHARPTPAGGAPNERDPRLDAEIQKMGQRPDKWNELMDPKKNARAPQGIRHVAAPGFTGDNVISEPPPKKLLPRIRAGMSEEDLRRIWAEDERKVQAQVQMAKGPSYVQKMNDHGTSPVNEHLEPHKQGLRVVQPLPVNGSSQVEPMGLRGVGQQCAGQPRMHGRRAPTDADFAVPKFEPKPRTVGIRMASRPKDTLQIG